MAGWMLSPPTMPSRPPPSCGPPIRTRRASRASRASRGGCGSTATSARTSPSTTWTTRACTRGRSATSTASGPRVAEHLGVIFHDPPTATLGRREMPGTEWFPGSTLNYAEHALTPGPGRGDDDIAAVAVVEDGTEREVTHAELRDLVARARAGLAAAGVGRGDRVVALAPNSVETLVAFLATASLGAVWSSCSPDFGDAGGARPLRPDRADRAGRRRRLPLQRQAVRRAGDRRRPCRRRCPRSRATVLVPHLDPGRRRSTARCRGRQLTADRRAAGVHARPVRPPAVGALLLRDDRAAQGHRAVARRDRRRAPQGAGACSTTSAPATGSCGSPPPAG